MMLQFLQGAETIEHLFYSASRKNSKPGRSRFKESLLSLATVYNFTRCHYLAQVGIEFHNFYDFKRRILNTIMIPNRFSYIYS